MKKNQIYLFIYVLFGLLPVHIYASDWSAIVEKSRTAIGKITVQDEKENAYSKGTGFVIDYKGSQILITNAHVIQNALVNGNLEIIVEFPNQQGNKEEPVKQKLSLLRMDKDLDIALLSLEKKINAPLKLNSSNPALMSEMLVIGYPLGESFKATPGFIQAYQQLNNTRSLLDMSATLAPGNSGGPVLNNRGNVIGIATSTIPGYNFNFAIAVEDVNRFLSQGSEKITVNINSTPPESWVFINGEFKGKTPLVINLFNRSYSLRIEKQGFDIIEETIGPWNKDIETVNRELSPEKNSDRKIIINTDPEKAQVYVNNRFVGVSPVTIAMPAGRIIRIHTEKRGHKQTSQNYTVTEDEEQEISIKLK